MHHSFHVIGPAGVIGFTSLACGVIRCAVIGLRRHSFHVIGPAGVIRCAVIGLRRHSFHVIGPEASLVSHHWSAASMTNDAKQMTNVAKQMTRSK